MNYNPNAGIRNPQGPSRKPKRVSDVNAMGPAAPVTAPLPYMQPSAGPAMQDPTVGLTTGYGINAQQPAVSVGGFDNSAAPVQSANYNYVTPPTSQHLSFAGGPNVQPQYAGNMPMGGAPTGMNAPGVQAQFQSGMPQFAMFQQPIVQDMAMQYGQRLADQGKQMVENQFEKWVSVAKLKYYFAVDNKYVINKLRLLFFPFTHRDWSLKYDQENPVQPRYDINAPDLYIPAMAYITYVVVAGLMLGMQNRFSPEQLGIQASSALAYCIFELVVYSITLYVVNIKTSLRTLDLLAFAGYKFVIIVACLLVSTLFHGVGYYVALLYTSLTLGFFLLRTLKTKVLHDATPASSGAINYDPYGNPQQLDYTGGRKRKLYFLFLIVGGQAFLSFLLSKHLYLPDAATLEVRNTQF
ncbi:protein YIF1B-B isoform X2 [Rhagoletis pomonella]|uniref:protein YIF1B-B isoform X2 n=1 Tax=Rhagoletis pomonella TaxID=28610 RepID=UPI00177B20D2|nr:protein YIF1B-B isoform X2 [Rhagoletis pomonella]